MLAAIPRILFMSRDRGRGRIINIIATVAVGTVIVGGSSLIPGVVTGGGSPPPTGTGNLWVDINGGTCTRSTVAITYNDSTACGSFQAAYAAAANSGDTICVKSGQGNYPSQPITFVSGKTTPNTVIQGCEVIEPTVLSVNIGGGGGTQPRALTVKDMAITGSAASRAVTVYYGGTSLAASATDITFDSVDIAVGKASSGPVVEVIGGTERLTIKNSTIGPSCCGNNASGQESGSPVGIRLGTNDRVSLGYPVSTDTVIQNNVIQGITTQCSEWLSGYGSCPQSTCPNAQDLCHNDAIQVYGSTNLTITGNRIYHNGINGIFIDSTDPNTSATISNNMIGDVIRGATCFDIDGRNLLGTWNIINNTCSIAGGDGYYISWASTMDANNAVWNWKGNIGAIFISSTFTPSGDCTAGTTGVFTYSYNTLSTNNGGATSCGGNTTVGDPSYVNTALAPTNTMDLHLSGGAGAADEKIPPATCSGFVTTDIDGQTRPQGTNCDAGADER